MSSKDSAKPCFQPGRLVLSAGVIDLALQGKLDAIEYFKRHLLGDWGNVRLDLGVMNELALQNKGRLFSAYKVGPKVTLFVVTHLGRSVTVLLLPEAHESFQTELAV